MYTYLLITLVAVAVLAAAYFLVPPVREWMRAAWFRWFKDSEVNFAADIFTTLGMLGEVVEDPSLAQLYEKLGISPTTLLVIGIVVRVLRMSRNRKMVPLTSDE